MTLNVPKCHLLVSGFKDELMFATVGESLICEELSAKLLGIIIASSLILIITLKRYAKNSLESLKCLILCQKPKGKF